MRTIPNMSMVVILDVGEADIIHPTCKEVVGGRLAYRALNKVCGYLTLGRRGPEPHSMEIHDGHAFLKFDFAPNGLSFMGKQPLGFEVAGEDKIFYPAKVRIAPAFWGNEGLKVWNTEVARPVAACYGSSSYVDGSLHNTEGLSASSLRTDNW